MCDLNSTHCCPKPKIVQEKICGNMGTNLGSISAWSSFDNTVIYGIFEVFNSPDSPNPVQFQIRDDTNAVISTSSLIPPGMTVAGSAKRPVNFTISVPGAGGSVKYCATIYRRVIE
ncbi:S-Ena type endospore appendage [Bacillus cereus]|uniref:S-Ena type endospore appendage n=1 Tax=Bacillus cereus TaxID=1396 RepID=UPI000BF5BC7F|nr:S-Ena type endospore appendage [Bacillus cereus]PEQ68078.1 hypothetical protein CN469_04350 [Bacillus cereus]